MMNINIQYIARIGALNVPEIKISNLGLYDKKMILPCTT